MLRTYLRQLHRDRRRIAVGAILLVAAVFLAGSGATGAARLSGQAMAGAALLVVAIPAFSALVPRYRHWSEVALLAGLVHVLLLRLVSGPASAVLDATPAGPVLLFAAVLPASAFLVYGRWSDRLLRARPARFRATLRSPLETRRLWYGLVPTPGHLDLHPDPEIVSVDYADRARRSLRLITWQPPRAMGETLIHIAALDPFNHVHLHRRVISGWQDPAAEGSLSLTFSDRGRHRQVLVAHETAALPLRRILHGWLDDTLGRMLDANLDAAERCTSPCRRRPRALPLDHWYPEGQEVGAAPPLAVAGTLPRRKGPPPGAAIPPAQPPARRLVAGEQTQ